MLVKVCKKAMLVLAVVMLLAQAAFAASPIFLERAVGEEVVVTCDNVIKEINIYVEYTILSKKDIVVIVDEIGPLFDDKGGMLTVVPDGAAFVDQWGKRTEVPPHTVSIGGDFVNEREIIGGVKTKIRTQYSFPDDSYELSGKYSRVDITINGQNLTFQDIPVK